MEPSSPNFIISLGQWAIGLLGAVVTILCGWNGAQQAQINALRERQDSLRDILATKGDIQELRLDVLERHRENLANIRSVVERLDRLSSELRK